MVPILNLKSGSDLESGSPVAIFLQRIISSMKAMPEMEVKRQGLQYANDMPE
jgi:hypothetical protein